MRTSRSLLLASTLFCSATSFAVPVTTETLVHDTTTHVTLDLNEQTVLCSSADYGALFLKVLIPQLAGLTLLDHQNLGAGAPCVAAGMCKEGQLPEDVIDPAHPTEGVDVNVKAVRQDIADADAQTCTTSLIERVHVTIRGIEFVHVRAADLGSRAFADCGPVAAPSPSPTYDAGTGSEVPADESGRVDEPTPDAGCSAGGGAASCFGLFAALGVFMSAKKRTSP